MRPALLILAIAFCGCSKSRSIVVERDTSAAFVLDSSKPFVIELGRGSGRDGLDTIKVDASGAVEMRRVEGRPSMEAASLHLSAAQVQELVDLVNVRKLTSMGRSYTQPNLADGTQWVLWIEQSPSEKSIYFNNAFPAEITGFADRLDALLQSVGLGNASWTPVPKGRAADEQKALWDRIK